jgi:hypothetical protein
LYAPNEYKFCHDFTSSQMKFTTALAIISAVFANVIPSQIEILEKSADPKLVELVHNVQTFKGGDKAIWPFDGKDLFKTTCDGDPLKNCLASVGSGALGACVLSGIETLGISCVFSILGGGAGATACFYSWCHAN